MRGGQGSATEWGMRVNGTTDAQYNRVFGPEYASVPGNVIIGAEGQNISRMPSTADLSRIQTAGGRRRRRGGFLGEVVNQAIVPMGLLAMQQTYRRKRHGGRHSRKHRRY